jgi:UDPglucose 6-dehydrogenase
VIHDPQALDNARAELADLGDAVRFEPDPYRAAAGAHAIALLSGWDLFRGLDDRRIYEGMVQPACLFDGRSKPMVIPERRKCGEIPAGKQEREHQLPDLWIECDAGPVPILAMEA